jgi:D-tyrosyl-tRNA(Tyr) deacylase
MRRGSSSRGGCIRQRHGRNGPRYFSGARYNQLNVRVLVQRVSSASVTIDGTVVGAVDAGLVLLVGFTHADEAAAVEWMADKVCALRIFADDDGKMNRSLSDIGGGVLVVSQFTLYGDAVKGRRPSFVDAARPETAIPLYERFVALLRERVPRVETGEFGAMMEVELVNDGPVTLWLER